MSSRRLLLLTLLTVWASRVGGDHWSIGQLGNHNPSFFPGRPLVHAREDCGVWEDRWATRVTDGDGQDVNNFYDSYQQSLRFEVQVERGGLFAIQPAMTDGRGPICPYGGPDPANPWVIPDKPQCERGDLSSTDGTAGPTSLEDTGGNSLLTFMCGDDQCGCSTVSVQLVDDGVPDCMVGGNGGITSPTRIPYCPGGCNPDVCSLSIEHWFTICISCVNDCPGFDSVCNVQVNEDETNIKIANWAFNINPGAANEIDQEISFTVTTLNPAIFTTTPYLEWSPDFPSTADLRFDLREDFHGTSQFCVTVRDNGGVAEGGCDTGNSICCTIEVTAVNDCPSWSPGTHSPEEMTVVIEEDAGFTRIQRFAQSISPGPFDEQDQNMWFNLVSLDPSATGTAFITPPGIDTATGDLFFEPHSNINTFGGDFRYYVQLQDDGGRVPPPSCDLSCDPITSCPVLTIVMPPSNDRPSYTPGPDVFVCEDEGLYCYPNWAKDITTGGGLREPVGMGGEGQEILFEITPTTPDLFKTNPTIDPTTGTLCFETRPNVHGTDSTLITIRDTAGGSGTSSHLRVNIIPGNDPPGYTLNLPPTDVGCLVVTEQSPSQVVFENLFTDVHRGAEGEGDQILSWDVDVPTGVGGFFASVPTVSFASPTVARLGFTMSPTAVGTQYITVKLSDNGGLNGCSTTDFFEQTLCVTAPLVPNTVDLIVPEIFCVREDDLTQPIVVPNFFQAQGLGVNPCLTVSTGDIGNPSLFSTQPVGDTKGSLYFSTASDQFGESMVSAKIIDTCSGNDIVGDSVVFTLCVTPCNDPPTFEIIPDALSTTISECDLTTAGSNSLGCCEHIHPRWARSITPGPDNENSQSYDFIVNINTVDANLFVVPPRVTRDGTMSFCLAPGEFTNVMSNLYVSLKDDGGSWGGCGDVKKISVPFQVVGVNDAPRFTPGPDLDINEDSGVAFVEGWATMIDAGAFYNENNQILTFSCVPGDVAIVSSCAVDPATGRLTVVTVPNAFGKTLLEVTIDDGQPLASSTTHTSTVTIYPINDPPSFTHLGDVTTFEDDCYSSTWVRSASPGPSNEVPTQHITYTTTIVSSSVSFRDVPSIDSSSGVLSYCPQQDSHGEAVVRVVARDDGGTSRGGIDTSSHVDFIVKILEVNDCPEMSVSSKYNIRESLQAVEDQDDVVYHHFLREVTTGPFDERTQQSSVSVWANPTEAFRTQPWVSHDVDGYSLHAALTPNWFGPTTLHIQAHDSSLGTYPNCNTSASLAFVLIVDPINDPPTFTPGPPITILQNTGGYTWPAWARNITSGPSNEDYQRLNFTVEVSNRGVFETWPVVDVTTGDMTFTVAEGMDGIVGATVCLSDGHGEVCSESVITVKKVEDSALYSLGFGVGSMSHTILEDAGVVMMTPWVVPGEGVSMSIVVDAVSLRAFESPPEVTSEGVLTYEFLANRFGVIQATLLLSKPPAPDVEVPFTITASPVNDPPDFDFFEGLQITAVRGGSPRYYLATANHTAGPGEDGAQNVVFVVKSDDIGVVSTLDATTGRLTVTALETATLGETRLVVTAADSLGGEASKTVVVNVLGVNTPPRFVAGVEIVEILEDSGRFNIPWAVGIVDLEGDEVYFTFETNPSSYEIVENLTVTGEGRLVGDTIADRYGNVTLWVTLWDKGDPPEASSPPVRVVVEVVAVNDAPGLIVNESYLGVVLEIVEDVGEVLFANFLEDVTAGGWGEETTQHTQVTVEASQPGLFTVQPFIVHRELQFTLGDHKNGEATLKITVTDPSNAEDVLRVGLVVRPVNDPPEFYVSERNFDVVEDSQKIVVEGWAGDITPGPSDEKTQMTWFEVDEGGAGGLFTVEVNSMGVMTLQPGRDRYGQGSCTVTLRDNGGTVDGGMDTSVVPIVITATIHPVNDPPTFTVVSKYLSVGLGEPVPTFKVAESISPGPYEGDQGVLFSVTPTELDFFTPTGRPTISNDGFLSFTPDGTRLGNATLSVVLRDTAGGASPEHLYHVNFIPPEGYFAVPVVFRQDLTLREVAALASSSLGGVPVYTSPSGFLYVPQSLSNVIIGFAPQESHDAGLVSSSDTSPTPTSPPLPRSPVGGSDDGVPTIVPFIILVPAVFLVVVGLSAAVLYKKLHGSGSGGGGEEGGVEEQRQQHPDPDVHPNPIVSTFPTRG